MKIAYEAPLFPRVGGGPQHFIGLSEALNRAGAHITHVLPSPSGVESTTTIFETVGIRAIGGRFLRQVSYECSRILLLLRWALTGRRFDVWMARHSILGVGLGLARLVADQVILEVNGPAKEEMQANFGSRPMAALVDWLFRIQIRSAHIVVAVSPGLARYVTSKVPDARCAVVPNGAFPSLATSLQPTRTVDTQLVFAGVLAPWYEMDVVLQAMSKLRDDGLDTTLLLFGDGVNLENLRRQAHHLGISDLIEFAGWVSRDVVHSGIKRAQVGLLPLTTKLEGLEAVGSPLKLYEYVAAGLKVVGTSIDGVTNSPVRDAVHAYIPGSAESCASAIKAALESAAPTIGEETWSWNARAQLILRLLATESWDIE